MSDEIINTSINIHKSTEPASNLFEFYNEQELSYLKG